MPSVALAIALGSVLALEPRDERPLPFISDDYARALGDARARGLPLFIEAWAPW